MDRKAADDLFYQLLDILKTILHYIFVVLKLALKEIRDALRQ